MDATAQFWRDPALPYVESRRACDSRACYKPHTHPTFSIGAVDCGHSRFTGASNGTITLHPGTVVFVPAGRVHACNPVPGDAWSYQMLHLEAEWLRAIREECLEAETGWRDDEPARIVDEPAVYTKFCRLNALLFSDADPEDKEAAMIEFMGDLHCPQGICIDPPPRSPDAIERILPLLDMLRGDPATRMPLEQLARLAGMSRYQLIRSFRAITGLTPHAWQLNERINQARKRVLAGEEIAALAHALGFADQAHFQRVFKAHTGVTPGCFRA